MPTSCCERIAQVPGIADARMQQAFNAPTLNVDVDRTLAEQVGLTERDVANSLHDTLAGSIQTAPTFWLNPKNGVSYPIVVQTPQYRMNSLADLDNMPVSAGVGHAVARRPGDHHRGASRRRRLALQRAAGDRHLRDHQGRDLGAVAADIQKILDETAKDVPPGSTVVLRGQVKTMTSAYRQLIVGLGSPIVLIYLLIVVNFQSWLDPFVIITACRPRWPASSGCCSSPAPRFRCRR